MSDEKQDKIEVNSAYMEKIISKFGITPKKLEKMAEEFSSITKGSPEENKENFKKKLKEEQKLKDSKNKSDR